MSQYTLNYTARQVNQAIGNALALGTINDDKTTQIELSNGTQFRRGTVEELTITLPDNIPTELDCSIMFTSGETPSTVSLPGGVALMGSDWVTDGVFTPVANTRYNLLFWFDGAVVWCSIIGVSYIAPEEEEPDEPDEPDTPEEPEIPAAYTLTISKGTGVASVTVAKTSGYGTTGALSSGATIYEGDVLSVNATASSGYTLDNYTKSITVSGNVTVNVTATAESTGGDTPATAGSGTEADPYLIATADDMYTLANEVDAGDTKSGVYYALSADIDLGDVEWNPIGANGKNNATLYPDSSAGFSGTLDGRGHVIYNMNVSGDTMYGGLFGSNFKGTVMNLGVESGEIDLTVASSTCGAIARKGSGKIINCYSRVPCGATARSAGIIDETESGAMVLGCYQAAIVTPNGTGAYAIKAATTMTGTIKYCLWDSNLTTNGVNGSSSLYANNSGITTAEFATAYETLNANLEAVASEAGIAEDKLCTWTGADDGYPKLVVKSA